MRTTGVVLVAILFGAGCLHSTHKIPRGELIKLAQTAPEARGTQVRVVQDITGDSPPPADRVDGTTVIIVDSGGTGGGGGGGSPAPVHHTPGKAPHLDLAAAKSDDARALLIVAALVAVTLAFTEGARYDGWVQLHPMHPVHMFGPGGYVVMPLAHIDPQTAAWAERAVVQPHEGPWTPLGRAPFDRNGWTYSVLMGAGQVPSAFGDLDLGFAGRVQIGYFPTHQWGLQLDWGYAKRDNRVGERIFDDRIGLELTFAPLDAGPFHAGVFGGLALASRFEDGHPDGRRDGAAVSYGALLQLGLTTRLAITGRLGASAAYDEPAIMDAMLGLSIY